MTSFQVSAHATHARFALGGAKQLTQELRRLNVRKPLFVCTARGAQRYRGVFESLPDAAGVYAGALSHCPEPIAQEAFAAYQSSHADCVISVGGGSTIGLGKYIAVNARAPHITVPTTACGSEATPIFGIKAGGEKRTRVDPTAVPAAIVYDGELAASLPIHETLTSSMNCLAHLLEAFYTPRSHDIARALGLHGVQRFASVLPQVLKNPGDAHLRLRLAECSLIGGWLVSMVGIGLHHKACHVIGGLYDINHADSNSVMLPHAVYLNEVAFGTWAAPLAHALGGSAVGTATFDFARSLGAPQSLAALGVRVEDLDTIAAGTIAHTEANPVPLTQQNALQMLRAAFDGSRPGS